MTKITNSKNKALIIGTIIYAIGNFGTKFLSFLIVPIYTYYILPTDMGKYDLLLTTVGLLSPIITMKISDATYRWIINDTKNLKEYISATYQILFLNTIICSILLLIFNNFFPIWNCYYFIVILVLDRALECLQKLLRGLKNQKLFVISGLTYTTIFLTLNLIRICYFKEGVIVLLENTIISQILTILLILFFEKNLLYFNLNKKYYFLQKQMLKYSIPLVPSALSWWIMGASDRYLIYYFLGSEANGIYAVAHKFPTILQTIFVMFNNSWTDLVLAKLERTKEDEEYVEEIFEKLYKFVFGITCILIPWTKLVMNIILENQYKIASLYISFLYLGMIFQGFSSFYSIGYLKGKNTKGAAITGLYGAIINLIVNYSLMFYLGLFAASISTFLGFFIMWLTRVKDSKELFPIKINIKKFSLYFILTLIIAIITIKTNWIVDLIIGSIMSLKFILENKKILLNILKKYK